MTRNKVMSSNISSVGYDEESKVMEVEFKNGRVYTVHDIPKDEHEKMINSSSISGHYHANIKNNYTVKPL